MKASSPAQAQAVAGDLESLSRKKADEGDSVKSLKAKLTQHGLPCNGCVEKAELQACGFIDFRKLLSGTVGEVRDVAAAAPAGVARPLNLGRIAVGLRHGKAKLWVDFASKMRTSAPSTWQRRALSQMVRNWMKKP